MSSTRFVCQSELDEEVLHYFAHATNTVTRADNMCWCNAMPKLKQRKWNLNSKKTDYK